MSPLDAAGTVVVLNPRSGRGDGADDVRRRAERLGYAVAVTDGPGDAIDVVRRAARAGTGTVVAAGGDGTVNEVLQGVDAAEAFGSVTVGVLPLGTGNNFAKNIGIPDVEAGFAALETDRRRRIDVGRADGRVFVNSCVGGLTADASSETSPELKDRLGVLAYVVTTLRSVADFESLRLTVTVSDGGEPATWTGEALCVLVGNGRRFTAGGSTQGNMEDGLFDVTVIENVSAIDLLGDAVVERLLGRDSPHVVSTRAADLSIVLHHPGSIRFSLDGEIVEDRRLTLRVEPRTVSIVVGDGYDPDPG